MIFATAALLAITNVTVIDGTGAGPRSGQTIVLSEDRIVSVSAEAPPRNARVLDGEGAFAIPGLWDMHTHVLANPWKHFRPLLLKGITGIRDMHLEAANGIGKARELRRQVEAGVLRGPRIVTAGIMIDGPQPVFPASLRVQTAEQGREAVRLLAREKMDFVKVYEFVPREAYFAILDEARKAGLPVAGHVPVAVDVGEAAAAGQRSIEHLRGVLEACAAGPYARRMREAAAFWPVTPREASKRMRAVLTEAAEHFDARMCRQLFETFVANRVYHCPTLSVLAPLYPKSLEVVRAMHEAGVPLLAGTDAGDSAANPDPDLARELELLVEAGLSEMEALQAATRNGAEFLGRAAEMGTLEAGKVADVVLLDANPLEDIRNVRRVRAVIARGRLALP